MLVWVFIGFGSGRAASVVSHRQGRRQTSTVIRGQDGRLEVPLSDRMRVRIETVRLKVDEGLVAAEEGLLALWIETGKDRVLKPLCELVSFLVEVVLSLLAVDVHVDFRCDGVLDPFVWGACCCGSERVGLGHGVCTTGSARWHHTWSWLLWLRRLVVVECTGTPPLWRGVFVWVARLFVVLVRVLNQGLVALPLV